MTAESEAEQRRGVAADSHADALTERLNNRDVHVEIEPSWAHALHVQLVEALCVVKISWRRDTKRGLLYWKEVVYWLEIGVGWWRCGILQRRGVTLPKSNATAAERSGQITPTA